MSVKNRKREKEKKITMIRENKIVIRKSNNFAIKLKEK